MIPVKMIDDLKEELQEVLKHFRLPSPNGEESEINIYSHALPVLDAENEDDPYPYIVVRAAEGKIGDVVMGQQVVVGLLIGIYDMNVDNKGNGHVLNIINDICERFQKNPVLKGQYYANEEIEWVLQNGNTYPYYFGGIELTFNTPTFRRENEYA